MSTRLKTVLSFAFSLAFALQAGTGYAQDAGTLDCLSKDVKSTDLEALRERLLGADGNDVLEFFSRCYSDKSVPACLTPVKDAIQQMASVETSFDVKVTDEPKRQPPTELLDAFDSSTFSFRLRDDVEAIAQKMGWPSVRYKSRHSGGFDQETPSLLMIRVPGATLDPPVNYDRYLNIALPADQADQALNPTPQVPFPSMEDYKLEGQRVKTMPRVFTIVSLEKPAAGQRAKVYFQMFARQGGRGDGRFSPMPNQRVRECVTCHPSGLRAISPLGYHVRVGEAQMNPEEWMKVEEMNLSMERDEKTGVKYGAPDWRGMTDSSGQERKFLVPAGVGPILGPFEPLSKVTTVNAHGDTVSSRPTRTKAFIVGANNQSGCAYTKTTWDMRDVFRRPPGEANVYTMTREKPVNWQKVRDAMKCSECHDHSARGGLNGMTDFSQIAFKVLVDQSMPPQAHKDPMAQIDPVTKQPSPNIPVVDTLTGDERIALVNCLQAEYLQFERNQMDAWLRRNSCEKQ